MNQDERDAVEGAISTEALTNIDAAHLSGDPIALAEAKMSWWWAEAMRYRRQALVRSEAERAEALAPVAALAEADPTKSFVKVNDLRAILDDPDAVREHNRAIWDEGAKAGEENAQLSDDERATYAHRNPYRRCTSCGGSTDSPPCQRDPMTGRGGHLSGGGKAAANPDSFEWLGMDR